MTAESCFHCGGTGERVGYRDGYVKCECGATPMSRGKSPPAPAAKPEPAGSAGRQQAAMSNLEAAVGNLAERRMSEGGTTTFGPGGVGSFNRSSAEMDIAIKIAKLLEQEKVLTQTFEVIRLRAWLQRIHDFSASAYTREDVQKALAGEVVP